LKVSQIAYLTGDPIKVRLIDMQPRQANFNKYTPISDFWLHHLNIQFKMIDKKISFQKSIAFGDIKSMKQNEFRMFAN
jgi:hypothetical protein